MKYKYFVSYMFSDGVNEGMGHTDFDINKLIESREELIVLENNLKERFKFIWVVIFNYRLYDPYLIKELLK